MKSNIIDLPDLREKTHVFNNRTHAGQIIAGMLETADLPDAIVLGIPAGGVPVGMAMASRLGLPFDLAVVSKITLPWNTEAGYGAVAFDGTIQLNHNMLRRINLSREDIRKGIEQTKAKVALRVKTLRGATPLPDLAKRSAILTDDGLASGFTMKTAIKALKNSGAGRIVAAVPTGHRHSVEMIATEVDTIYCTNIRSGLSYAVAAAYRHWSDVTEEEVAGILKEFGI